MNMPHFRCDIVSIVTSSISNVTVLSSSVQETGGAEKLGKRTVEMIGAYSRKTKWTERKEVKQPTSKRRQFIVICSSVTKQTAPH